MEPSGPDKNPPSIGPSDVAGPQQSSQEAAATARAQSQPEKDKNSHRFLKAVWFVVGAVAGTVISTGVNIWIEDFRSDRSNRDPLEVHVTSQRDRVPPSGYAMVVPDPARLPPDLDLRTPSCAQLWQIGVGAGGMRADKTPYSLLLRGRAHEGVTIVDMRAVVRATSPPVDGALLTCPTLFGGGEAIPLTFDFTQSETPFPQAAPLVSPVPAQRYDFDGQRWVDQFADGYVITVDRNEEVPLYVTAHTTTFEGFTWRIEATVVVGGRRDTVVIKDGDKDFSSPGIKREYPNVYNASGGGG